MPRHLADLATETRQDRLDRLAGNVRRSLQEYLEEYRDDPTAVIVDWAACIEWSNPEAERRRASGRVVACEPDVISQATINGLGLYMAGLVK